MKRKTVLVLTLILLTGLTAARWVPLGAPADAPALGAVLQEGNKSSTGFNMSFYGISGLAPPVDTRDAATKGYVDNQVISQSSDDQTLGEVLTQGNDMNGQEITDSQGPITLGGGNVEIPGGRLRVYGEYATTGQTLTVGDDQYGISAQGGDLFLRAANQGFIFRNNSAELVQIMGNGNLNMRGNTVTNTQMLELNSISLPVCDSSTEGNIAYNGTAHYGCDGSSWNQMY
ncbi:hypothetical protein [Candidatus Nanohalococcus occultus]|uniref:hypothetical protein n=1 Tax=Candidatus Nanohalococcus occultus TaxID=2978047 RepID=UPI00325F9714